MTDSGGTRQWLIFGWPLSAEGDLRREVDARLYTPTDDGSYTVTQGTIQLGAVGLERIGDFEISPGVLALHQVPSAQRAEFLKSIPNSSHGSKNIDSKSSRWYMGHQAPWSFTEFAVGFSRIQHLSLGTGASQTYQSQRAMTDWETARQICYRIAGYFGLPVLRNATIIHEPDSPDLYHQTLRITFESPVDEPSLLHGTIERDIKGVITFALWYRFTTPGPWHEYCLPPLNEVGEIDVIGPLRALIIELIALAEHGFTRDEIISYLGCIHDGADDSEWSQFQLAATNAVEDRSESSLSKLEQMLQE